MSPPMIASSVDLPQPEGPSTVRNSCGATSREMASSAGTGWSRVTQRLATARTSMWGPVTGRIVPRPGARNPRGRPRARRPPVTGAWYTPSAMPPRWRSVLADIEPYVVPPPLDALAAELGQPVLRLSANENPLGPSPLAVAAIRREAERIHLYPDGGAPALAEAVADALGIAPGQLLFGNGGDEILTLLGRALLEPGDEVVVPDPSFEPYTTTARLAGATVVPSPLRDYRIDLDDVLGRVGPRTKLVCLSSPHNPTGSGSTAARGSGSAPGARTTCWCSSTRRTSTSSRRPTAPRTGSPRSGTRPESLVLLRTFSKITGLAGLRVGYAIASPGVIGQLERTREPFNVGRVAQAGAAAAARDPAHREATRRVVWAERRALSAAFAARGLSHPADRGQLPARAPGPARPARWSPRCGRGACWCATGPPSVTRATSGSASATPEQNARLLAALDRALAR